VIWTLAADRRFPIRVLDRYWNHGVVGATDVSAIVSAIGGETRLLGTGRRCQRMPVATFVQCRRAVSTSRQARQVWGLAPMRAVAWCGSRRPDVAEIAASALDAQVVSAGPRGCESVADGDHLSDHE